jgi:hypothetical protein
MIHGGVRSACAIAVLAMSVSAAGQATIESLIGDIKAGPRVYRTSGAVEYLSRSQGYASQPPMPDETERANKALRAAIALGEMGGAARAAIGALVDLFPIAVHAVSVYETYVASEGSVEDWVMTKVMGEKNKFLFAAPFLGYEQLSRCDQFLEVKHEYSLANKQTGYSGGLSTAGVSLHVQFTFHAGACALQQITGAGHGTDVERWRLWWQTSGQSTAAVAPATPAISAPPPASASVSTSEVVKGATYRFTLRTGDVFTARVESMTDTSLIAETDQGAAYTFRIPLIRECVLVSMPKEPTKPLGQGGPEIVTYDELKKRSPTGVMLLVSMKGGKTFKGKFASAEDESVKLDVDGSVIPIHKDVITQITTVAPESAKGSDAAKPKKREGPYDTLIVRNPKTDQWGKRMASFVYWGTIIRDYGDEVSLERDDGTVVQVKRTEVERLIKHSESADATIDAIQVYAKPLYCPDDMVLVDIPPSVPGKPFMKVCVDRYEHPNLKGAQPKGNLSFAEAQKICIEKGKRLCTVDEWQWACSGKEDYQYPYGQVYDENTCNTSTKGLSGGGSRTNCVSKFGAHDMSGNVFEWVTAARGKPMLMGGPVSKCQTVSPGLDGSAKPLTGVRCCKSN